MKAVYCSSSQDQCPDTNLSCPRPAFDFDFPFWITLWSFSPNPHLSSLFTDFPHRSDCPNCDLPTPRPPATHLIVCYESPSTDDLVGRPATKSLAVNPSLLAIEPTVPLCLHPIALLPLLDFTFSQSLLFCDFGFRRSLFPFWSQHSPITVARVVFLLCSDVPTFALRAFGTLLPFVVDVSFSA